MSAPDTNVEKQSRNHWGPLTGMAGGLIFVGILFIAYMTVMWEPAADEAETTTPAPVVQPD